jgi:hypothetical protein
VSCNSAQERGNIGWKVKKNVRSEKKILPVVRNSCFSTLVVISVVGERFGIKVECIRVRV